MTNAAMREMTDPGTIGKLLIWTRVKIDDRCRCGKPACWRPFSHHPVCEMTKAPQMTCPGISASPYGAGRPGRDDGRSRRPVCEMTKRAISALLPDRHPSARPVHLRHSRHRPVCEMTKPCAGFCGCATMSPPFAAGRFPVCEMTKPCAGALMPPDGSPPARTQPVCEMTKAPRMVHPDISGPPCGAGRVGRGGSRSRSLRSGGLPRLSRRPQVCEMTKPCAGAPMPPDGNRADLRAHAATRCVK